MFSKVLVFCCMGSTFGCIFSMAPFFTCKLVGEVGDGLWRPKRGIEVVVRDGPGLLELKWMVGEGVKKSLNVGVHCKESADGLSFLAFSQFNSPAISLRDVGC